MQPCQLGRRPGNAGREVAVLNPRTRRLFRGQQGERLGGWMGETMSFRKRHTEEANAAEQKRQRVHGGAAAQQRRRHYGLFNQGATCYLNSVLQVLSATPEIQNRLDPESKLTDEELKIIFGKLRKETWTTESITKILDIENVHQQRDAAECLETVLRRMSAGASKVFQGALRNSTKCCEGHLIIQEVEPFWTLPLSLRDNNAGSYSVERGIKNIFSSKLYSEDNLVFCKECNQKTEATSRCEMVEFPQVLSLLLKRFEFDYDTMLDVKSNRCVDVPLLLRTENRLYQLYGMVEHMGSIRGGHYTATVHSPEDKTWYYCDDSHVEKREEQLFSKKGTHSSSTAYLLMYTGTTTEQFAVSPTDRKRDEVDKDKGGRSGIPPPVPEKRRRPFYIFLIAFGCLAVVIVVILLIALSV